MAKVFCLTCHNKHLDQLYSSSRLSRVRVDPEALNQAWGIGHKSRQINCCYVFYSLRRLLNVISSRTWDLCAACSTNGTYPFRCLWRGPVRSLCFSLRAALDIHGLSAVLFSLFPPFQAEQLPRCGSGKRWKCESTFHRVFMSSSRQGLALEGFAKETEFRQG